MPKKVRVIEYARYEIPLREFKQKLNVPERETVMNVEITGDLVIVRLEPHEVDLR